MGHVLRLFQGLAFHSVLKGYCMRLKARLHLLVLGLACLGAALRGDSVPEAHTPGQGVVVVRVTSDAPGHPGFERIEFTRTDSILHHGAQHYSVIPTFQGHASLYLAEMDPGEYTLTAMTSGGSGHQRGDGSTRFPLTMGNASFKVQADRVTHLGVLTLITSSREGVYFTTGWDMPTELFDLSLRFPWLGELTKVNAPLGWINFRPSGQLQAFARTVPVGLSQPTWTADGRLVAGSRYGLVAVRAKGGEWSVRALPVLWDVVQVIPQGSRTLVALLESGLIYRSEDDGKSWKGFRSPLPQGQILGLEATASGWRAYAYRAKELVALECGRLEEGAWKERAKIAVSTTGKPSAAHASMAAGGGMRRVEGPVRTSFCLEDGSVFHFDRVQGTWSELDLTRPAVDLVCDAKGVLTGLRLKPGVPPVIRGYRDTGAGEWVEVPSISDIVRMALLPNNQIAALSYHKEWIGPSAYKGAFSPDGGSTWTEYGSFPGTAHPRWMSASPDGSEILVQLNNGDVYLSRDVCKTWTPERMITVLKNPGAKPGK